MRRLYLSLITHYSSRILKFPKLRILVRPRYSHLDDLTDQGRVASEVDDAVPGGAAEDLPLPLPALTFNENGENLPDVLLMEGMVIIQTEFNNIINFKLF